MSARVIAFAALMLYAQSAAALLLAGDADRGVAVHERQCVACHVSRFGGDGSGVYTRENRMVSTIEGLMGQVERCNAMTRAGLADDEIDDLVAYLNETYYRFGE